MFIHIWIQHYIQNEYGNIVLYCIFSLFKYFENNNFIGIILYSRSNCVIIFTTNLILDSNKNIIISLICIEICLRKYSLFSCIKA